MDTLETADFAELTIKHLIMDRSVLDKANELRLKLDDFGSVGIYRQFVDIALQVNDSPISKQLFAMKVLERFESNQLDRLMEDQIIEFIEYIYSDDVLNSDYIINSLSPFIKLKRSRQIQMQYKDDPDEFAEQYNALVTDIRAFESDERVEVFSPFETFTSLHARPAIPTGITRIDASIMGFGVSEYNLIMGQSGAGKTALSVILLRNAALQGKKALYLSLEEMGRNINNRFYASALHLSYSNIHNGQMTARHIEETFESLTPIHRAALINNVRVADLNNLRPVSCNTLKTWLDRWCQENEFFPDLVMIDQLEFMQPSTSKKTDAQWEQFNRISQELEGLSNYLICGEKAISLLVQHQLSGKLKCSFDYNDISGAKGIVRPADTCIAIGRSGPMEQYVYISSLKVRHSSNFRYKFRMNFEMMSIEDCPQDATSTPTPVPVPTPTTTTNNADTNQGRDRLL